MNFQDFLNDYKELENHFINIECYHEDIKRRYFNDKSLQIFYLLSEVFSNKVDMELIK